MDPSNNQRFKWTTMWVLASAVLLFTLWYGWYTNGGDISYGRLTKIPFQEIQWYHVRAPLVLLILTRIGVPVSTSFFSFKCPCKYICTRKDACKTIMGYAVAGVFAYVLWILIARWLDERNDPVKEEHKKWWRIGQWITTGFLWFTWLSHDVANIAVFLPRAVPWDMMIAISLVFVLGMAYMFREGGGKIQKIVLEKQHTRYVRSACIIDAPYFLCLFFPKN